MSNEFMDEHDSELIVGCLLQLKRLDVVNYLNKTKKKYYYYYYYYIIFVI